LFAKFSKRRVCMGAYNTLSEKRRRGDVKNVWLIFASDRFTLILLGSSHFVFRVLFFYKTLYC
jgi:hypothetical protein